MLTKPMHEAGRRSVKRKKKEMNTEKVIGKYVVCRSNTSGVWFGKLESTSPSQGGEGWDVELSDAAKVHFWEGTAATSGLAVRGPGKGSRICPSADTSFVACAVEVILCSPVAIDRFADIERWEP